MSSVPERVSRVLAARGDIAFAVLFGSAVTGRFGPRSDIDLAVRFAPGKTPAGWDFGGVVASLEAELGRTVDLVELPRVRSAVLLKELAGGTLVKGSQEEFDEFKLRASKAWRDFGPRFERMSRALAQRFAMAGGRVS